MYIASLEQKALFDFDSLFKSNTHTKKAKTATFINF